MSIDGIVWRTAPAMTYASVGADGRLLFATSSQENKVFMIDVIENKVITSIAVGKVPKGVKISQDGIWLYVAVTGKNQIVVLNTKNLRINSRIEANGFPSWLAVPGNP